MEKEELNEKLKKFHGELYSPGPWNSKNHNHCRLCKTKNTFGKKRHWANGLCRSCYRRLSPNHRLYNDNWNQAHSKKAESTDSSKKSYKYVDPDGVQFDEKDIETLLERYDFKCAYSKIPLQDYDYKLSTAFQVEYKLQDNGLVMLVPVARFINCSKKNLLTEKELRRWAIEKGIPYPFSYITAAESD